MKPLILSVFANDSSSGLDLTSERQNIEEIFQGHDKIELEILDEATIENLYSRLEDVELRQRIVVFHFGGHAGANYAEMVNGKAFAPGLAQSVSRLPNLQLVFLNGCNTFDQTQQFISLGVKCVITSITSVDDRIAIDFCRSFFSAYVKFNSLNDSFEFAKAYILTKHDYNNFEFFKNIRGLDLGDYEEKQQIYSLVVRTIDELNRTLQFDLDVEMSNPKHIDYLPCRALIKSIAESVMGGDPPVQNEDIDILKRRYSQYINDYDHRQFNTLAEAVLDVLPFPIGYHVNILLSLSRVYGGERENKIQYLNRQIITYYSFVQLLSFTLISCFWNELQKNKNLNIRQNQWKVISDFISSNEINSQEINYPFILITVRDILFQNELAPFIEEYDQLREIFSDENEFYECHLHIQGLKKLIENEEILKLDIHWICYTTELLLKKIFSKSGFIVRYKLSTVKSIELYKSRLNIPYYYIKRIILDTPHILEADIVPYAQFTDSHSVILAKGADQELFTNFLSLSPFILDENSLKGEDLSKLYFYSHSTENGYVYTWAEDPKKTLVVKGENTYLSLKNKSRKEIEEINKRLSEVKSEIDTFKELIYATRILRAN